MFHNASWTDSATSRGMTPQGKGREGKRKGRGGERYRDLVCGSFVVTSQIQVQSVPGERLGSGE